MKFLILTADKQTLQWRSLDDKLAFIRNTLNSARNSNWSVEIEYTPAIPTVNHETNRIDHDWLNELIRPYFSQGYDVVAFHYNKKQRIAWDIQSSLRGANPRTNDEMGDFYFWADEDTDRKGFNQFEQTCLHEFAHEYYSEVGGIDLTHTYHNDYPNITGLFASMDFAKYQPRRMALKTTKNLLERIVGLLRLLNRAELVPKPYVPTSLQPKVKRAADNVVAEMKRYGHPVRLVEGFRSLERQNKLYEQGRTTPGAVVTNARAGESLHNYGVAVDFVFRKEGYNASDTLWSILGLVGKKQGFEWGGDWDGFVDRPHFQLMMGYNLKDFQDNIIDYDKYK